MATQIQLPDYSKLLTDVIGQQSETDTDTTTDVSNVINTTGSNQQNTTGSQTNSTTGNTTIGGTTSNTGSTATTNTVNQTTQNSADIAGLQQVFGRQMAGITPDVLSAIFTEGAKQVPQLTNAFANAAGTRAMNNSPLQLALTDLNSSLVNQAAMMNNQMLQQAGQTAGAIAGATGTQTTTGTNTQDVVQNLLQTIAQTQKQNQTQTGTSTQQQNSTNTQTQNQQQQTNQEVNSGTKTAMNTSMAGKVGGGLSLLSLLGQALGSGGAAGGAAGGSNGLSNLLGLLSKGGSSLGGLLGNIFGGQGGDGTTDGAGGWVGEDYSWLSDMPSDWAGWGIDFDLGGSADGYTDGAWLADGGEVTKGLTLRELQLMKAEAASTGQDPRELLLQRLNAAAKAKKQAEAAKGPHKGKTEYDRSSKMVDPATGIRFADGGEVPQLPFGGNYANGGLVEIQDATQLVTPEGTTAMGVDSSAVKATPGQEDAAAGANAVGSDLISQFLPTLMSGGGLGGLMGRSNQDLGAVFQQLATGVQSSGGSMDPTKGPKEIPETPAPVISDRGTYIPTGKDSYNVEKHAGSRRKSAAAENLIGKGVDLKGKLPEDFQKRLDKSFTSYEVLRGEDDTSKKLQGIPADMSHLDLGITNEQMAERGTGISNAKDFRKALEQEGYEGEVFNGSGKIRPGVYKFFGLDPKKDKIGTIAIPHDDKYNQYVLVADKGDGKQTVLTSYLNKSTDTDRWEDYFGPVLMGLMTAGAGSAAGAALGGAMGGAGTAGGFVGGTLGKLGASAAMQAAFNDGKVNMTPGGIVSSFIPGANITGIKLLDGIISGTIKGQLSQKINEQFADGGNIEDDAAQTPEQAAGISDDMLVAVSPGEYVISKDVVDVVGKSFLDTLQSLYHTPAAVQRAKLGTGDSNA